MGPHIESVVIIDSGLDGLREPASTGIDYPSRWDAVVTIAEKNKPHVADPAQSSAPIAYEGAQYWIALYFARCGRSKMGSGRPNYN
jgi:hypothetical protein